MQNNAIEIFLASRSKSLTRISLSDVIKKFYSIHNVCIPGTKHGKKGHQGPTKGGGGHQVRHPTNQEGEHDVAQTTDA